MLTVRDVRVLAEAHWSHYFSWKTYTKWQGLVVAAITLLVAALVLAILFAVTTPSLVTTSRVMVDQPGTIDVVRSSSSTMIVRQNGNDLPMLTTTSGEATQRSMSNLLLVLVLAALALFVLWYAQYYYIKREFLDSCLEQWMLNHEKVPTDQMAAEFLAARR